VTSYPLSDAQRAHDAYWDVDRFTRPEPDRDPWPKVTLTVLLAILVVLLVLLGVLVGRL
jgi:hypothetical protein